MLFNPTTVAIAGITGKLARLIVEHLLKRPDVKIHGICRKPSKLPETLLDDPRLDVFQTEATDSEVIKKALIGVEVVICCYLGDESVMIDGQKTLIDACIAEGVSRYIASDFSMDFRKLAFGDHSTKDPMKHIQTYLEERNDQIKAVHILNACFLEAPWRGLLNKSANGLRYWGTGEEKWELTTYDNVAEYTAEVVMDPNVNGFVLCKLLLRISAQKD
jgi:putative NADH-flavin reductase